MNRRNSKVRTQRRRQGAAGWGSRAGSRWRARAGVGFRGGFGVGLGPLWALLLGCAMPVGVALGGPAATVGPVAGSGRAQSSEVPALASSAPPAQRRRRRGPALPAGRAVGDLSERACLRLLRGHAVAFHRVPAADAQGIDTPILLDGPIGGVEVRHRGGSERNSIMDCRLAVALLVWAPALREAGVSRIDHLSIYRPRARIGNGRRVSGHAHGLAIDAARFHFDDGARLLVEETWTDQRRIPPCPPPEEEPEGQRRLRALFCDVVATELFQVALTPHHDHAHRNHLHLELRPGVDWEFVR